MTLMVRTLNIEWLILAENISAQNMRLLKLLEIEHINITKTHAQSC